jgi:6-phosphogluconolactonase
MARLARQDDAGPGLANRGLQVFETIEALSHNAADRFVSAARQAIAERDRFVVTLSGGSSVRAIYESVATADLDWRKVFFFWGDERFVDQDNPYSNYRLAAESILSRISVPAHNIFAIPVDAPSPSDGARLYEDAIRRFFDLAQDEWPRFDLTLNGMGPDGHTGSLFPNRKLPGQATDIAQMSHAGMAPWIDRITLTMPVFNHARQILVVATGPANAPVLRRVMEERPSLRGCPASALKPAHGCITWLVDQSAARLLSGDPHK